MKVPIFIILFIPKYFMCHSLNSSKLCHVGQLSFCESELEFRIETSRGVDRQSEPSPPAGGAGGIRKETSAPCGSEEGLIGVGGRGGRGWRTRRRRRRRGGCICLLLRLISQTKAVKVQFSISSKRSCCSAAPRFFFPRKLPRAKSR